MIFGTPPIVMSGSILLLDASNPRSIVSGSNNWFDLTRTVVSGSLVGSPIYRNDGPSIQLNGSTQYVDLGSVAALQFTNTQPFTVSTWFKWVSGVAGIFCYALLSGNNRGYYIAIDNGGIGVGTNCFFFDYYDGSVFRGIQSANSSVTANTWLNLVATSNSNSSAGMKLYLNGAIMSTSARAGSSTPSSISYTGVPARVGARQTSWPFNGNIGHVFAYNRELSAQEIQQNFNALKTRYNVR